MIFSQMAMDLDMCYCHQFFCVLEALLVRMHELVLLKMVAAEPVAAELSRQFSQQIFLPVFCSTPTMQLKMM